MSNTEVKLELLGIPDSEMSEYMQALKSGFGLRERYICLCGHQMARHVMVASHRACMVGKSWCSCSKPIPAVAAEKVKPFRFASTGYGKRHALAKGLFALQKSGLKAYWLIDVECFRCSTREGQILPTPISLSGLVCSESGKTNALLCLKCIFEIGGILDS